MTVFADGTKTRTCVCGQTETVTDSGTKAAYLASVKVGDIILESGRICKPDAYNSSTMQAVAVVVREKSDTLPMLAVGIYQNTTGLKWCLDGVEGHHKLIKSLAGYSNSKTNDGRDGWEKMKRACSDAEEHPEYYPAWNYALEYALINDLQTDFSDGWYLPVVAELKTIIQNKEIIDASLELTGSVAFSGVYLSCCQHSLLTQYVYGFDFSEESVSTSKKNGKEKCLLRPRLRIADLPEKKKTA